MRKFIISVLIAVAAMAPGVLLRLSGAALPPIVAALVYGAAIVAAGFLLTWSAEGETHASKGLIVVVLALVTVLPEYSVDIYLALKAGANPGSQYVQLAAANMTGANRLLVGFMWPLLVLLSWLRGGGKVVKLNMDNAVEISFMALASVYAFVIVLKRRIDLLDMVVLFAIFAAYVWRASKLPREEAAEDAAEEAGPAAALLTLPKRTEHTIIALMVLVSAVTIIAVAEPFAESLISLGSALNINEFLLIQWVAPLVSEAPVVVVTVLFALRLKPQIALASLVSDKINQWTLLVAMLPLFFSIGARGIGVLPLDARQGEEFFLTAAQSLFGVALLLRLRLNRLSALALLVLFLVQLTLAFVFQADEPRTIRILTVMAWVYLALAAALFLWSRRYLVELVRVGIFNRQPRLGGADGMPRGTERLARAVTK